MQSDSTRQPYIDTTVPDLHSPDEVERTLGVFVWFLLALVIALGLLTWLVWSVAT